MARLGKLPVEIPEAVKVEIDSDKVVVSGPKGEISRKLPLGVKVKKLDNKLVVERATGGKSADALQGTIKSHLTNMLKGVTQGWAKTLEIKGPGYRAEVKGKDLILTVGYSHPVVVEAPEGISFKVEKSTITVEGVDKEIVGQIAAQIRASRPPNPYKGAGIAYSDEEVRRKAGKQAAGAVE